MTAPDSYSGSHLDAHFAPLSADDVWHEVLIAPRRMQVVPPELQLIERSGWVQRITPTFVRGAGVNSVDLAVIAEHEVDRVIDETIAMYRAIGCELRWLVGPDSAPADLATRLARRGLKRTEVSGMALATSGWDPAPPNPDITVERVDAASLDEFAEVMVEGWGDNIPARRALYAQAAASDHEQLYLARYRGEPAAGGSQALYPRSAYFHAGVVLPQFRAHGIYRALVDARVAAAAACGKPIVTTHARLDSSAPRLEHMGFREVVRMVSFRG